MINTRIPSPIFTSPSGRYFQWARIALASKSRPNIWWLALPNVPRSTYEQVQRRKHPDLRNIQGGRLEAEFRNRGRDEVGREAGDLFVRFVPEED